MIDTNNPLVLKVIWAALCSMVLDVHAPQDNLTEEEWDLAEDLYHTLNDAL